MTSIIITLLPFFQTNDLKITGCVLLIIQSFRISEMWMLDVIMNGDISEAHKQKK